MKSGRRDIEVKAERSYVVAMVPDWKSELEEHTINRRTLVVTTESISKLPQFAHLDLDVLKVPDGEFQKDFRTYRSLLESLAEKGFGRRDLLVAIGGGATTDLVGFVASTYMRGLDWIAIPTTVAGMVDAAIGGKTGINLDSGKNLVGAFHSPLRAIIDLAWLETLPLRDRQAGLAEVAKCGFIADPTILDLLENGVEENLAELIYRSVKVKSEVVSQDFKESGLREILNYGHTLGHAVETDSKYLLRHGEAIAIGLSFAAAISLNYGSLSLTEYQRHRNIMESLGLPTRYDKDAWERLVRFMERDKKRVSMGLRFVTLDALGKPNRIEISDLASLERLYDEEIADRMAD